MRTRIVKGKLNIITNGDHNIYAREGNVVSNASGIVTQTGTSQGVSYGNYKSKEVKTLANCIVSFRPTPKYKGEFGFDWNRTGDVGLQGDVWYRKIIGNYVDINGNLLQVYYNDPGLPDVSFFKDDVKKYESLIQSFRKLLFFKLKESGNKDYIYIIPKMTIWKGDKVELTLKLNIIEEPEKLEFAYNKEYFTISGFSDDKISAKSKGKRTLPLSIECKKVFQFDQTIDVLADGQVCGRLQILRNNLGYKANVVIVPVKTKVGQNIVAGNFTKTESTRLKNILKQPYIEPNIKMSKVLDLSSNFNSVFFNLLFSKQNKKTNRKEISDDLNQNFFDYLDANFFSYSSNQTYKGFYRIYVFQEDANGLNGQAEDISNGADSVVTFGSRNKTGDTAAHELLHAIGLFHTFDNDGEFTLERTKTDNIMDYSHWVGIDRISTYHWQWKIIRSALSGNLIQFK